MGVFSLIQMGHCHSTMRLCAACLLGLLFGCALGPTLPSYALSDAEKNAVVRGIYSYSPIQDKPTVRTFKAATNSSGEVYVCGWMHSDREYYRDPEQAYTGTLSAGQFSAERIGMDANTNAIVVAKCHERGISM